MKILNWLKPQKDQSIKTTFILFLIILISVIIAGMLGDKLILTMPVYLLGVACGIIGFLICLCYLIHYKLIKWNDRF